MFVEDLGPLAELHYWKLRLTQLSGLADQLRARQCKTVLQVLVVANDPLVGRFQGLDTRVTDVLNEVKDNVKYLTTLEKFVEPMYAADPARMIATVPGLISAIRIMHSIARHYNTSEKMTSLFTRITNQMILCCRSYLEKGGSVWDQDTNAVISKLRTCQQLNQAYQAEYRSTKAELASNLFGKQFDFGEVAIFSRFDSFCSRMEKLIHVLQTTLQFSTLARSPIEGIGPICVKFEHIFTTFRRRNSSDVLDTRKSTFDVVYSEFCNSVADLTSEMVAFVNNCFLTVTQTTKALDLLAQFRAVLSREHEALLEEKHLAIFHNYGRDLEMLRSASTATA